MSISGKGVVCFIARSMKQDPRKQTHELNLVNFEYIEDQQDVEHFGIEDLWFMKRKSNITKEIVFMQIFV